MQTTTKNIKPLSDYILVKTLTKETTLPSGIVLPDSAQEKSQEAKVIAVGPGKKDDTGKIQPLEVKKNDIILYKKWGGTEVKVENEELLLIREEDVIALIKE
jgi:chaperonin GroES